jgi:hypothetical protein
MELEEEIDFVEVVQDFGEVDVVEAIYGPGHDRYCNYRPYISERGIICCMTCDATVNSLSKQSDYLCPCCGCPTTCHGYDTGHCYQCERNCPT